MAPVRKSSIGGKIMKVDQLVQLVQDMIRERGRFPLIVQQLNKLGEFVDELGNKITQHGEEHGLLVETIVDRVKDEVLEPILVALRERKEGYRMSTPKTIPQLNQKHEALCKLLEELGPGLEALGIFSGDQLKMACGRYQELLGNPLAADASEDALDELEYRLEHLGPLATVLSELAARMEEERRQHKQELNGWRALGQLDQVAALLTSAKTRKEVIKRLTEEARGLREEKKQLAEEQNRMKGLCKQATEAITRLREERDRMKGLCVKAAAALKAKAASGT